MRKKTRRLLQGFGCEAQLTIKTPHGVLSLFCPSFRCRCLEVSGCADQLTKKNLKRHMVFPLFYCISFSCRLLEGSGCGDESQKNT